MPNIATLHPQVVHFVIALGLLGVVLRIISLLWQKSWLNPAAATLLILGALAGVPGQKSGMDNPEGQRSDGADHGLPAVPPESGG